MTLAPASIATINGRILVPCAARAGHYCAHRPVFTDRVIPTRKEKSKWVITHEPSGLRMLSMATIGDARRIVAALAVVSAPDKSPTRAQTNAMRSVLNAHGIDTHASHARITVTPVASQAMADTVAQ